MVGHEGRDEIIAVVVSWLAPQHERYARVCAGLLKQLGPQLLLEELVGGPDVDEQLLHARSIFDQRDRVMLPPRRAVGAEIAGERLLPPRHLAGRNDRGEGRHAAETVLKAKPNRERAVTAH